MFEVNLFTHEADAVYIIQFYLHKFGIHIGWNKPF